ncbi:MAG: preprotein translocase subunit SecE [Planctomycetota bacterium]|jgi:preprotein translocase subunit SecE|nr:preprotein translocase subunit SecE [Planctomycetota bacterium]MDP7250042.1 preprotein translocase subunit SecE [Planctomycetota bacterium]
MFINIHKKGQGMVARLAAITIATLFSYFLGVEVHIFLHKFFGASEGLGMTLGVVSCVTVFLFCAHYIGRYPKTVDYLIETETEMRKVNWPTKDEVVASTGVVIACVVVLSLYIFVNDLAVGFLLEKLRIF